MKNNSWGYAAVILLLSLASVFSLKLYLQQRIARDQLDIHNFPYTLGDWRGEDIEVTEEEYSILETRNMILREYQNSLGDRLTLFIIYSETNRLVFHPPEVCLLGSGVKVQDKQSERINFGQYNLAVNKLYTAKGSFRGLSLYCYKAGTLYTDNYYLQQGTFSLNQLLGRHKGGATIRVSMPIVESEEKTLEKLKSFFTQTVAIIDSLPSETSL